MPVEHWTRASVSLAVAICVAGSCQFDAVASPRSAATQNNPQTAPATSSLTAHFSAAQVKRGELLYQRECARCHLENLKGSELAPALVGTSFLTAWQGKMARALYGRILSTMPSDDPGRLSSPDVLDVVAFVLQSNGHLPGEQDLTPEDAQNIPIDRH